jgi:hypothetical protein
MSDLIIYKLPEVRALVIKKDTDSRLFITTPDSIIISSDVYIFILRSLVAKGLLDYHILEGILEELNSV